MVHVMKRNGALTRDLVVLAVLVFMVRCAFAAGEEWRSVLKNYHDLVVAGNLRKGLVAMRDMNESLQKTKLPPSLTDLELFSVANDSFRVKLLDFAAAYYEHREFQDTAAYAPRPFDMLNRYYLIFVHAMERFTVLAAGNDSTALRFMTEEMIHMTAAINDDYPSSTSVVPNLDFEDRQTLKSNLFQVNFVKNLGCEKEILGLTPQ
jgi:hypothetical protein